MRLLIPFALIVLLVGCSGGGDASGAAKNPEVKRMSEAEYDAARPKRGGGDGN